MSSLDNCDDPRNGAGAPDQGTPRANDTTDSDKPTAGALFSPGPNGNGPTPSPKRPRKPRSPSSACADAHDSGAELADAPPSEPVTPTAAPGPDPFDLAGLRLSQDFAGTVGVKKRLVTVPVRKPNRQEFVRVRPGEGWRLQALVLELKDEREQYVVTPALALELAGEAVPKILLTAISRQGVTFIWPIRLPGEDGRHDEWNASALEAAQLAETRWTRVSANMSLGAYDVCEAVGSLPEPEWPAASFQELIKIGFKGRLIDSPDHPVLRRLRGEA